MKNLILSTCMIALPALAADASTMRLGWADTAYITTDQNSKSAPFGFISGFAESFGLGCIDGRYCDMGYLSLGTNNGINHLSLSTQLVSFNKAPISSIFYGLDKVVVSTLIEKDILDLNIDYQNYIGPPPPPVKAKEFRLTFSGLQAGDHLAYGFQPYAMKSDVLVEYIAVVPAPLSGLLLASALGTAFMLRRKKTA